jgi:hypothetical protein
MSSDRPDPTRPDGPRTRSPLPSAFDVFEDVTGAHSLAPDKARALHRRIGRIAYIAFRWLVRTKMGTLLTAIASFALTWLSHHLWHWIR